MLLVAAVVVASLLAAASAPTVINVTSVSPRRIPIEGGGDILVSGSGFTLKQSVACRIASVSGGASHTLSGDGKVFPATVLNSTALRCEGVPVVVAEGLGKLEVVNSTGFALPVAASVGAGSDVLYFALASVAVGLRPFIGEGNGTLLVSTAPELRGAKLSVTATLPAGGATAKWQWAGVAGGTDVVLPLDFSSHLPTNATIHNDITVSIDTGTRTLVKTRRFHRVPSPAATSAVEPVQVDHASRQLSVGGTPFNCVGWYMESDIPLSELTRLVQREFAPRGVNCAMVYGLSEYKKNADRMAFMDACAAVGFKIMWSLVGAIGKVNIQAGGPFNQPALLKELEANVSAVKDHKALLGYYICA